MDYECLSTLSERKKSQWETFLHRCGIDSDPGVERTVLLWDDGEIIAAGSRHILGLRSDGTVLAAGDAGFGACAVSGWRDIQAIAAGDFHSAGLRADGTVIAVGYNNSGQCDVGSWSGIIAIAAGGFATLGLKSDGTIVCTDKAVEAALQESLR